MVTAATGGTGTLPYLYGLLASTGASIVLDEQVQQKIAIGDYSGAVDQATYHFPGFGYSRSLVEALSEGNILGALLSSGSLGAEVLSFLRGVRVPGVALKLGAEAGGKAVTGTKLLSQFNSVESIINASTFEQLKRSNQALQAYIRGDGEFIFKILTQGGQKLPSGAVRLPDGTELFKHISKTTGEFTLDINKAGQIYKVRINP